MKIIVMKTLRMIGMAFVAVILCLNFSACSDDELTEEKPEGGIIVSSKKIVKIITESGDWKETRTFNYDDKGRLIKATETDDYNGDIDTDTYQFIWGDDVVKAGNCTFYIENGLIQTCDDGTTFTYNQSKRLVKCEETEYYQTAIWDGDKLVSMSNNEGYNVTFTYKESCKKGYHPFLGCILYDECGGLFYVHPELVGARCNQLFETMTHRDENGVEITTFTYEFDKEGYVTEIIATETDGSVEKSVLTWE